MLTAPAGPGRPNRRVRRRPETRETVSRRTSPCPPGPAACPGDRQPATRPRRRSFRTGHPRPRPDHDGGGGPPTGRPPPRHWMRTSSPGAPFTSVRPGPADQRIVPGPADQRVGPRACRRRRFPAPPSSVSRIRPAARAEALIRSSPPRPLTTSPSVALRPGGRTRAASPATATPRAPAGDVNGVVPGRPVDGHRVRRPPSPPPAAAARARSTRVTDRPRSEVAERRSRRPRPGRRP